ncbi:MAG: hypothetical protein KAW12_13635 [Candidatus Aminicenantes bacterium]|nr:hypothetical protein [Candidatus Aminicenantes bacterium]
MESRIDFSKEAFKTYRKLDATMKKRVDRVLLMFLEGDKLNLKPIKGTDDTYRIRIGAFRVLIKKIKLSWYLKLAPGEMSTKVYKWYGLWGRSSIIEHVV